MGSRFRVNGGLGKPDRGVRQVGGVSVRRRGRKWEGGGKGGEGGVR